MLEAYYFAHSEAVNTVLDLSMVDHADDVELIRHPKNDLKNLCKGFDAIEHGAQIVELLDLPHILSRQETCRSLRTLFGWCWRAIGERPTEQYNPVKSTFFLRSPVVIREGPRSVDIRTPTAPRQSRPFQCSEAKTGFLFRLSPF